MAVVWRIGFVGFPTLYTLAELGVRTAVRETRSLAVSELRLTVAAADVTANPAFAFGQDIRLYRDSVCWFAGTVSKVTSAAMGKDETYQVTISDGWWKMERRIYKQLIVTKQGTPPTTLSAVMSSRVVLGKDAWGSPIASSAVITDILSQAGFASAPVLPTLITGFYVEARDITLADAVRRMLALTPDCVGWFSYSSGAPVFQVVRRASLGTVNYDLEETPKRIESFALTPRNDLLLNGVVLTYISTAADADGATWLQYTQDVSGSSTGDAVLHSHVELAGQGTDRPETAPAGLAANFLACYNTLQWEGSITLHEREVTGTLALGTKVNLLNGRAAWATMGAVVASVTEDLFAGTTEAVLGPPPGLGIDDFVDIMRPFSNRTSPSAFVSTQDNGTAGVPILNGGTGPKPDDGDPQPNGGAGLPPPIGMLPYVDIQYCRDGEPRIFRGVGTDIGPVEE